MRTRLYLFGRVNVFGQQVAERDKYELFDEALSSNVEVSSRQYMWGFFDVEPFSYEGERFFDGHLVKFMPRTEEEFADLRQHRLRREIIKNRLKAKARFLLHPGTGLIAYHRAGGDIDAKLFRTYFAAVVVEAFEGFFIDVHVDVVQDETAFLDRLRSFSRITEIKIELHPTNPAFRREYRDIHERLKATRTETYRETYRSAEGEGLEVEDDKDINGKLLMASDGYGAGSATGELEGEEQTIATGESPIAVSAPSAAVEPETLMGRLFDTFQTIWKRVK